MLQKNGKMNRKVSLCLWSQLLNYTAVIKDMKYMNRKIIPITIVMLMLRYLNFILFHLRCIFNFDNLFTGLGVLPVLPSFVDGRRSLFSLLAIGYLNCFHRGRHDSSVLFMLCCKYSQASKAAAKLLNFVRSFLKIFSPSL